MWNHIYPVQPILAREVVNLGSDSEKMNLESNNEHMNLRSESDISDAEQL